MSWVTAVWSTNAAACLTLAGFYFVVWCKQRQNPIYLLFSCSAMAAAAISAFELWMLNSKTVEQYELLVRWIHVPTFVLTLSFVAFVRLYLRAGRAWLAWSIYGLRTLVLILNFISAVSINFTAITSIRQFSWGGQLVSVPVGTPSPWGLLSSVSLLLLLIFSVDATITVWRRGDRRRALLIGSSMIFGAMLAWHVPLVIWGILDVPFFLGFTYTAIVAVMGYELSNDVARAAGLARELEISEKRLNLAADSANLGMWEWTLPMMKFGSRTKAAPCLASTPRRNWISTVFEAGCIPTIANRCSRRSTALWAPAQNINLSTEWCYRMGNCAGSPGAAMSSSTVTVNLFGCAALQSTSLSASWRNWRRRGTATRWRIFRA